MRTPEAVSELDTDPQLHPDDAKFHNSLRLSDNVSLTVCDICVSACPLSPPLFTSSMGPRQLLGENDRHGVKLVTLVSLGLLEYGSPGSAWPGQCRALSHVGCELVLSLVTGECHWLTKSS